MSKKSFTTERQTGRSLPWLPHRTGRYYWTQIGVGATGATGDPNVNTLYAFPIFIPDLATYTRIAIHTTTAGTGSARLGIYNDNTGVPGSLVLDAGTVARSGTGAKEITISQSLARGWYWTAYVADQQDGIHRGFAQAGCLSWLGAADTTGQTTNYTNWQVAFTYATLPDPFQAGGALGGAAPGTSGIDCFKIMLAIV